MAHVYVCSINLYFHKGLTFILSRDPYDKLNMTFYFEIGIKFSDIQFIRTKNHYPYIGYSSSKGHFQPGYESNYYVLYEQKFMEFRNANNVIKLSFEVTSELSVHK